MNETGAVLLALALLIVDKYCGLVQAIVLAYLVWRVNNPL